MIVILLVIVIAAREANGVLRLGAPDGANVRDAKLEEADAEGEGRCRF